MSGENDATRAAVRDMISRGLVTAAEAARLSGQSRQLVRYWAADLPDSRETYLQTKWQQALTRARSTRA